MEKLGCPAAARADETSPWGRVYPARQGLVCYIPSTMRPSKLEKELEKLLDAGALNEEAAQGIRAYYREQSIKRSGTVLGILSALGGVLVCAGIVLLAAHNWYALPGPVKVAAAALLILVPGGAGLYLTASKRPPEIGMVETIALFHSLLFGAALALVGQIYQVPEAPVAFLALYTGSALALAYFYGALGAGIVALLLGQILAGFLVSKLGYPPEVHVVTAALVLPLWGVLHSRAAPIRAAWTLGASAVALFAALIAVLFHTDFRAWMALPAAYASLILAAGGLLEEREDRAGAALRVGGTVLAVVLAFIGTWDESWGDFDPRRASAVAVLLGATAALAAGGVFFKALRRRSGLPLFDLLPLLLSIEQLGLISGIGPLTALVCVVLYAGLGFWKGWVGRSTLLLNGAFILSLATVIARFFDSTESMLARGVAFLVGGLALLLFNKIMAPRLRRGPAGEGDDETGD